MNNEHNHKMQNIFYNKRVNLERSTNVEKRARLIQTNPVPLPTFSGILGYTQIFKVFNKQIIALENANETGMGLMTFAFEGKAVGEGGRRNFLVCHPRMLWNNIKDRPPDYRCTYEVIPEGKISKLYFDLEFSKELNTELDGSYLTSIFIHVINYYLLKEFNIICDADKVLHLESSTDKKFSRHLIYNNSDLYFENNYHVGRFVSMICDNLKQIFRDETSTILTPNISKKDIKKLFVRTNSSTVLFCDQGVYTRNRNFRIFGSTKLGKHSSLVIARENKYEPVLHTESFDENYFLDSLVTFAPADIKTLKYGSDDSNIYKSLSLDDNKENSSRGKEIFFKGLVSPYTEIEDFINKYLGEENVIRTYQYFSDKELIVFEIDKRFRYCNNIGREHKSNSIMYVVNLRAGVFYQKCHDPECRGYKSNEINLPAETMPWKLLAECVSEDSDDDILIAAADKAEIKAYKNESNNNDSKNNNNDDKSIPMLHHFKSKELSANKMEQTLFTPPRNTSKSTEAMNHLPSPWSHLSQIEAPSSVSGEITPPEKIFTSVSCKSKSSIEEGISDEEMLMVFSGFDGQAKRQL